MAKLFAQWVEDFKKGRDEAFVARGFRQNGSSAAPETDAASAAAEEETPAPSLITKLSETIKTLQTRNGELEAERDEAKKLLTEIVADAEPRKQRLAEQEGALADKIQQAKKLDGELRSKKKLIEKLAAQIKALQARGTQLEGERDTLAAALEIPGMAKVMRKVVHEDAHPGADADQRRQLTAWSQTVNGAFALIKRLKAARQDDTDG